MVCEHLKQGEFKLRGAVGVKDTLDFKGWGQKHMQHIVLPIFILITCCNDNVLDILGYIKCIVTFHFPCFLFTHLTWLLENLTFKMWLVLYCSWAKRQSKAMGRQYRKVGLCLRGALLTLWGMGDGGQWSHNLCKPAPFGGCLCFSNLMLGQGWVATHSTL